MNFSKKVVGILGLASSGISSARVLYENGAKIIGFDDNPKVFIPHDLKDKFDDIFLGVKSSSQLEKYMKRLSILVVSPGIPFDHYMIQKAFENNVEVISEIELGYILSPTANIIAITGTNGKSTTTYLIHRYLVECGRKAFIGGNIGVPFTSVLMNNDVDSDSIIVLETSSFQLRFTRRFRPKVAVITNMVEDHLDRHPNLTDYLLSKAKLLTNQTLKDYTVMNAGDKRCRDFHILAKGKLILFSKDKADVTSMKTLNSAVHTSVYMEGLKIIYRSGERSLDQFELPKLPVGLFHLENILASIAATRPFHIPKKVYVKVLKSFEPLEGRLHYVNKVENVCFYNDTKATNPSAMLASIDSLIGFGRNIILIAGGRNKNLSFEETVKVASKKITGAVLFGETANYLAKLFQRHNLRYIYVVSTLDKAVRKVMEIARENPNTEFASLLAPGCASFDQFPSAEARGRFFDEIINRMAKTAVKECI